MSFTHLGKRSKPKMRKIHPKEVELTTMGNRGIFTLRFGGTIAKELDVIAGKHYQAWWGTGSDQGIIQLRGTVKGDPDSWEVVLPKRTGIPQITISHLPDTYQGRKFARAVVPAEYISTGSKSPAHIRIKLPPDFFSPPPTKSSN